jgi:hypothetical protein
MKVLIPHDWAIFRSGIKQILADEFVPQEVMEGAPVPEGFDMGSGRWDLALVGVGVLGRKGLHLKSDEAFAVDATSLFRLAWDLAWASFVENPGAVNRCQATDSSPGDLEGKPREERRSEIGSRLALDVWSEQEGSNNHGKERRRQV